MESPQSSPQSPRSPHTPVDRDRVYRSPGGLAGGVLVLVIGGWLGIDALVQGHGNAPWIALAALILLVPLTLAFSVRPAVFAGRDRLRVRNPFRVIVLPWGQIDSVRSGFSNEVLAKSGTKYQLWAVPVSIRGRKRVERRQARDEMRARRGDSARRPGLFGGGGSFGSSGAFGSAGSFGGGAPAAGRPGPAADTGRPRTETDKVIDEIRELLETRGGADSAQGEVTTRWSYEVIGPAVAGALLLIVLLVAG
jgi:uncharacterized membrane protein YgcG